MGGLSRSKAFAKLKDESIKHGSQMLLILDAWNEQTLEILLQVRKFVNPLLADGTTRILVTSRPVISTESAWLGDGVRFFELQKWSDAKLSRYFHCCECAQALRHLPIAMRQALKLPFLASIFVSVFSKVQSDAVPQNIFQLLERVIEGRFRSLQHAKSRNLPIVPDALLNKIPEVLQTIAYLMTSSNVLQLELKAVCECCKPFSKREIYDIIAHLIDSGILRNAGEPLAFQIEGRPTFGERFHVSFIHQIFQEFLTAQFIYFKHLRLKKQPRALLPRSPSTDLFWMDVPLYLIESFRSTRTSNAQSQFVRSFFSKQHGVDLLTAARLIGLIDDAGLRDEIRTKLIQSLMESLDKPTPYANIIKAFYTLGDDGLAAVRSCLIGTDNQIGVYAIAEAQHLGYPVQRGFEVPWRRLARSIYLLGELGDVQVASHIEKLLSQIRSTHLLYHYAEALLTLSRQRVLQSNDRQLIARCAKKLALVDLKDPVIEAYACAILRECGHRTSSITTRSLALAAFLQTQAAPNGPRFRSGFWRRAHGCEAFAEVASIQDCAKELTDLFVIEDYADYGNYTGGDFGAVHSSILKAVGRACSRNRVERNCWRPLLQSVFKSVRIANNGWACNHLEKILTNYFDRPSDISWLRGWKISKLLGGESIRVVLTNVLKGYDDRSLP